MYGGHIFYVCNLYQKIGQLANVGVTFFLLWRYSPNWAASLLKFLYRTQFDTHTR